jgi:hypothetical protein
MPKTKISEYSSTASDNTDINGIDLGEGTMLVSDVNNALREQMAQLKDFLTGDSGDSLAVAAGGTGSTTADGALTSLGGTTVGTAVFKAASINAAQQALDLEVGVDVQAYDATILKSADIGVTVQGYDANTLKSSDIGVTVQGYDADTVKYDDVNPSFTDTGALKLPAGTEAQRPTGTAGQLRFNEDTDSFEGYNGTAWGGIGGAQAGGAIVTNKDVASVSYVIDSGENGFSVGPITVADGTTITVSDGQRWVII